MHLSYDDQYMFSVGEDGTLLSFRLIDKEGRMLKREREANYAEEVLITRSDLEEKVDIRNWLHAEKRTVSECNGTPCDDVLKFMWM